MRTTARALALTLVAIVALGPFAGPAGAAEPPPGTVWSEHYFASDDGLTVLHADVLRPKGIPEDKPTPVILTVSPYLNHATETGTGQSGGGPSPRFYDFLEVSDIIDRGYTYVMVDLPGFGGSSGCNDWGGVREQGAVKAAVEWAATQPWSTGRVGMMGKSYDAWTGLMGMAQRPKGLAAVVAMEPVYSGYRYLYHDGVRYANSVGTPAIFQAYDAAPGPIGEPEYTVNGAPRAYCYGVNLALQQQDDPQSAFWLERDLVISAKGSKTPLFLTQGFLETNTKPDGAFDFWNGLRGDQNRAWFGQFDHVRGWEKEGKRKFAMGRDTFVDEMMRFLDHHVKGVPLQTAPVDRDPVIEVQDALGRYRAESQWPPSDAHTVWNKLNTGTYLDNATNQGAGSGGEGIWSISQPLPYDVWLTGEPIVKLSVDALPRANVTANIYDITPAGRAVLISRGTHLVRGAGDQDIEMQLYGQDWPLAAGHRIGVVISSSNSDWWTHIPTFTDVVVLKASVGLPFLTYDRDEFLEGRMTARLKGHLRNEDLDVSGRITDGERRFEIPARLRPAR